MITYTFLAIMLVCSLYAFNDRNLMGKFLFYPYAIRHNGEHYRFLTHAFIHGDYIHLAFNCIAFYSFGLMLEEKYFSNAKFFDPRLGKILYIILFTGGIYAASIAEYFRNKDNRNYTSLGASGAISAIIFCYIMVAPNREILFFFFPMKGWLFGIGLLILSAYLIRRKRSGTYSDHISHEAHFWGALFGVAFTIATRPAVIAELIEKIRLGN